MLIPEQMADSGFDVFNAFRCLQGFTSFVSLIHTCRDISSAFTVTSTTATFRTEAAYGCLKPDPTTRLRRTYLHLGYSIVLFEHVLGTSHPWHRHNNPSPHLTIHGDALISNVLFESWTSPVAFLNAFIEALSQKNGGEVLFIWVCIDM